MKSEDRKLSRATHEKSFHHLSFNETVPWDEDYENYFLCCWSSWETSFHAQLISLSNFWFFFANIHTRVKNKSEIILWTFSELLGVMRQNLELNCVECSKHKTFSYASRDSISEVRSTQFHFAFLLFLHPKEHSEWDANSAVLNSKKHMRHNTIKTFSIQKLSKWIFSCCLITMRCKNYSDDAAPYVRFISIITFSTQKLSQHSKIDFFASLQFA